MEIDKKSLIVMFLCVSITPAAIMLRSALTLETGDTVLFVQPPLISRETLIVGERISVDISVANVTDLRRYELTMNFNTVMLDVVTVTLLPEDHLPVGNWVVSDALGMIWINATYEGPSITAAAPVALVHIQFKTMNRGESPLHLHDTGLFDSIGNGIPHSTEDGMVIILKHDVAIANVTPSTMETYTGRLIDVTVVAQNLGDLPENFTVSAYHNNTAFTSHSVVSLAPDANVTLVFTWNTSDVVAGNVYTLKAETSVVPFETDLANNILTDGTIKVKIIGDVNGDNAVNLSDWIAYDAAWGTHQGDPTWNIQADINGDGVVDNADGVLIAQNYRNTV